MDAWLVGTGLNMETVSTSVMDLLLAGYLILPPSFCVLTTGQ